MISRALHLDVFDPPGRKLLLHIPSLRWEVIKGRVKIKDVLCSTIVIFEDT
jgi:hypothetical protein